MANGVFYKAFCQIRCNNSQPYQLTALYESSQESAIASLNERIEAYRRTENKVEIGEITVKRMGS